MFFFEIAVFKMAGKGKVLGKNKTKTRQSSKYPLIVNAFEYIFFLSFKWPFPLIFYHEGSLMQDKTGLWRTCFPVFAMTNLNQDIVIISGGGGSSKSGINNSLVLICFPTYFLFIFPIFEGFYVFARIQYIFFF